MNLRHYNIGMTNATHITMDECYKRNGERKKQDTKANDSEYTLQGVQKKKIYKVHCSRKKNLLKMFAS